MKLGPWQKILLYFNERLYIFFGSSVSGKHVLAQPTIIINKYQCHHTADWIWWVSKKHWISTGWRIFSVRFDPTYSRRYTGKKKSIFPGDRQEDFLSWTNCCKLIFFLLTGPITLDTHLHDSLPRPVCVLLSSWDHWRRFDLQRRQQQPCSVRPL